MTLRGGTDVTGVVLGNGSRDTPQCITTSAIFPRKNLAPQRPLIRGHMGLAAAVFPWKNWFWRQARVASPPDWIRRRHAI